MVVLLESVVCHENISEKDDGVIMTNDEKMANYDTYVVIEP
jgi:hypothetical protein